MPLYQYTKSKKNLLVLLILMVVGYVDGQNALYEVVSFTKTKGSATYFLKEIEQQANVVFSYSNRLCLREDITLSKPSGTIQEILNELFMNCPATYLTKGKKIIIEPYKAAPGKFIVKGFVVDRFTNETLIQANVYEPNRLLGTITNNFGFFSISLPAGRVSLYTSYVGYEDQELWLNLTKDTTLQIALNPIKDLDEVEVIGERIPNSVKSTRTGTIDIPIDQVKNIPVFMGEVDVVKSIQLLPGVQSGGEGLSELYVRGGGPDQNLVLMDDVPVYNVSHLLGFFSVFNADAVNHVSVVKGGFPARYGGRLSSVVDIRMYEGNNQEFKGAASVGLLSSRVSAEGPIVKDKGSFSVAFRRTYFDVFTSWITYNDLDKNRFYFYDFNAKLNYKMSDKDRLYLSGYTGKDQYVLQYNEQMVPIGPSTQNNEQMVNLFDETDIGWKNNVGALRWNHIYGEKLFSNVIFSLSDYRFFINQKINYLRDDSWSVGRQNYYSGIRDISLKADFDFMPSPKHYIRFGAHAMTHTFFPGIDVLLQDIGGGEPVDTTIGGQNLFRAEFRSYVEDDFHLTSRLKVNAGLHFSMFQTESKLYKSFEPRVSARYLLNNHFSFKGAYSQMTQYMHLLRTATFAMPTDLWLPVSDNIEPMRAEQVAMGLEYEFAKGFSLSLEGYYKWFSDILAYREAAGFFDFSSDWEDKLASGSGYSKGLELLVHKKRGKLSGWLGYTWSKTMNTFPELNNGKEFPADFDRTHDISLFTMYKLNKSIDITSTWTFGTGNPITLPELKYHAPELPTTEIPFDNSYHQYIRQRNSYRMPNFHRLDIGLNMRKETSYGSRMWSFGVLNVYSRQNPFFLYFSDSETPTGEVQRSLKQLSLFPFPIPYARLTIKF